MNMAAKPHLPEMTVLRAISILAVLMVHATSSAVVTYKESSAYPLYSLLNSLSIFCVPAFIFLTGFVLFYHNYDRPLTWRGLLQFYRGKLLYIVVPYFMISVSYFLYFELKDGQIGPIGELLRALGSDLLFGTAYPHLYYVFVTIQLYLLFPLLLQTLQRWPRLSRWTILIGFAVQWGFYASNYWWLQVPAKGSISLSYFAPFLLGAYMGMYGEQAMNWMSSRRAASSARLPWGRLLIWGLWLCVAAGYVWLWYAARRHGIWYSSVWYEFGYNAYTFLSILVLLQVSHWMMHYFPMWLKARLFDLAALSFGIYLIHPIILYVYRQYPPASSLPWLYPPWVAGGYVLALGIPLLLLLAAYRLLPFAWILFGKVPDKYRGRWAAHKGERSKHQSDQ